VFFQLNLFQVSRRVDAEEFRLGVSRFWKTELFSSFFSGFIQKFLSLYILLKKKLNLVFFKIVFFKILFLKNRKVLILVNIYKIFKLITDKRSFKKNYNFLQKKKRGPKGLKKKLKWKKKLFLSTKKNWNNYGLNRFKSNFYLSPWTLSFIFSKPFNFVKFFYGKVITLKVLKFFMSKFW